MRSNIPPHAWFVLFAGLGIAAMIAAGGLATWLGS